MCSPLQVCDIELQTGEIVRDVLVLFVVSGGQNRIVNYRMSGTMMVVDYYIDHAILVSGVGGQQQKITINRGG